MSTHPPSDRLNESLKRLHNLNNEAGICRERAIYARSVVNQSIVEGYIKGELSLVFDVQVVNEVDIVRRRLSSAPSAPSMNGSALILQLDVLNGSEVEERNQEPMLVSFIESVNGPDGKIPSVIGLYFVNDEPKELLTGFVYYSPAQRAFKSVAGGIHREFGEVANSRRNEPFDDFDPRIIEGTF